VQIISAVIGSTLIVTALTSFSSVINNPNIYLQIQPQISEVGESNESVQPTPVSSYQITARNDGRSQATNLTLSMFIRANITHWTPILHSEEIEKNSTINYEKWSLLTVDLPRFTSGAVIILRLDVKNATIVTPYFVSAAYDQGSSQFPNYLPADIREGRFPDIMTGRSDPIQLVIIVSLILSALAFAVTFIGIRKLREKIGSDFPINRDNLIWFAPAIIISSVFLLYIFEEVPRNLLISSLILSRPADVTTGLSVLSNPEGSPYNQGILLLGAFAFCGISWFARGFIGYLIVKKIISKLSRNYSKDDKIGLKQLNHFIDSRRFRWLSYFLIGTPFYSFVLLFLPKSVESLYSASLFMIFLLFEIAIFLILTLVMPKLFFKNYVQSDGHMRTDLLYYPLVVFSILLAILHFIVVVSLLKTFTSNSVVLESIYGLFWTLLIFCVITGIVQIFISIFIARSFITQTKLAWHLEHKSLMFKLLIASIITMWVVWIYVFAYITTYEPALLRTGIPVISIGIVCIILGLGSMVTTMEIINPKLINKFK
jgi:hypothetical protein